jgi:hypothetical protein
MRFLPNNNLAQVMRASPKDRQRQSLLGMQRGNFAARLGPLCRHSPHAHADTRESFITIAPAVALSTDAKVNQAWEAKAPNFNTILSKIAPTAEKGPFAKNICFPQFFLSTTQPAQTPERR